MRSQHVDKFNHDPLAAGYDLDVRDEAQLVRAGYDEALNWVARTASRLEGLSVLELGTGSGNLATRLTNYRELTCVDISEKMMELAKHKLSHANNVEYTISDLLQFFDVTDKTFDCIVSTYAIHHLTEDEKMFLFEKIYFHLNAGGSFICGDVMFENEQAKQDLLKKYIEEDIQQVIHDIHDEFFWDLSAARKKWQSLGGKVEVKRFSELSWGIHATK